MKTAQKSTLLQHNLLEGDMTMYPKIFLTGATGLVGGGVLYALHHAHPDAIITALVRDETKGKVVTDAFPPDSIDIAIGDMKDAKLIERLCGEADVVLHMAAAANLTSVKAIHHGLSQPRGARGSPTHIQIGGSSTLAAHELLTRTFGEPPGAQFDDWSGLSALHAYIREHPEREMENYMLDMAQTINHPPPDGSNNEERAKVNTAFVIAPLIYGKGRGPVNQRSIQIPELARVTIERGAGVKVGKGENRWAAVHLHDLSDLIVKLVGKTLKGNSVGGENGDGEEVWGKRGWYLAHDGEVCMGDLAAQVAQTAADKQLMREARVDSGTPDEADPLSGGWGAMIWGTNASSNGLRARKVLGWEPQGVSVEEDIARVVDEEAVSLKLKAWGSMEFPCQTAS